MTAWPARAGGRQGGPGLGSMQPHTPSLKATSPPSDLSHAAHGHCPTCCLPSAQSHGPPDPVSPGLQQGRGPKTPGPWPQAPPHCQLTPGSPGPGRALAGPCRTGCFSRNPIISRWGWGVQETEVERVDPTLPTLETGPFRVVSKAGTGKTGSPPAPPPRPPASLPAPSSPEPPPAPGDLLPPSQTPRVPAPAPWSLQAPQAEMLPPLIYPGQPSPSFWPAGSHLLLEAFPDSAGPPATGRCPWRLLVLGAASLVFRHTAFPSCQDGVSGASGGPSALCPGALRGAGLR